MIYARFGDPITLVRRATLDDVRTFENHNPDKYDEQAVAAGMYFVARYVDNAPRPFRGSPQLLLTALHYLKADGGSQEINDAILALDEKASAAPEEK